MIQPNKPAIPLSLMLLLGIIAISFSSIFIRWSSSPIAIIAMYRLLIMNICLLPFLAFHRHEITGITPKLWLKLMFSGISLGLHFLFWMESLRWTTVASSTAILTLEPIFVMIGSLWIFQLRINRTALFSMFIAISGAILIGWGDFHFSGTALQGDLLSLLGTFAIVINMLFGKSLSLSTSTFVYSFFVFLFAGLVLAIHNIAVGYSFTGYPLKEWGIFLLLALIPTLFGHYLFNWLLKHMHATSVSMAVLGEPIGATILAYFILGEMVTWLQVIAGCILLVGVAFFIGSSKTPNQQSIN